MHAGSRSAALGGRGPCRALLYILSFLFVAIFLTDFFRRGSQLEPGTNLEVAKVSMLTGRYRTEDVYVRSHELQKRHDEKFGYKNFVLNRPIIGGYWDRTLYMMSLITQELAKTEEERIRWLLWHDADITLMNPNLPLEVFLPPEDQWSHVHMLVTNDANGLNNGAFFLRVHPWSIQLLKTVLGIDSYETDVDLEYSEQTALELWLLSDAFREHVMHVPQRWFNAYPTNWNIEEVRGEMKATLSDNVEPLNSTFRKGDLFIHFAGQVQKTRAMQRFTALAEQHERDWEPEFEGSELQAEIESFWTEEALEEDLLTDRLIGEMQARRSFRKQHGLHEDGV